MVIVKLKDAITTTTKTTDFTICLQETLRFETIPYTSDFFWEGGSSGKVSVKVTVAIRTFPLRRGLRP